MCRQFVKMMARAPHVIYTKNLSTTPQKVMTTNSTRMRVIGTSNVGASTHYYFGDETPTNPQFTFGASVTPMIVRLEDIGELIREPLWVWLVSGTTTGTRFTEIYALPNDYQDYINGTDRTKY